MPPSLATNSCDCNQTKQQLIVVPPAARLQLMVATPKQAFARRLNALCDAENVPQRGRRVALAKVTGVSGEAARKWISGEAIPAMDHVVILATHFRVNAQWLLTGLGPQEIGAGALTEEEQRHIERLRCMPSPDRARAFRVIEALSLPDVPRDNAA
jgi:hypothetical protein